MAGHYQLFARFLHLLPILWFFLELVIFQNGLRCLLASPFHHSFDPQVVNIAGSETDINGRIDSVVCGLSCCCPIPSSEVRLDRMLERETKRIWGEFINMQSKDCQDAMLYVNFNVRITPMQVRNPKLS